MPLPPRTRPIVLALPLLLAGCPTDDDDDDPTPGDGRVVVAGVGSFASIQDALDAAPPCASITVAAGEYKERLRIRQCVTLVGVGPDLVFVDGGGGGTIVDIDQVDGAVLVSGMSLIGPGDEPATIRGVRATDSSDVTLNDMLIGFEPDLGTGIDHGNVGIDVSRSTIVVNGVTVNGVGFGSEVGGACLQAQTDSDVTVDGSTFVGGGSFGIHADGGSLFVKDTEILATNRSTGAQQFESDGSGIFAEAFSEEVTLENVTIDNGSFVAAWMEVPRLNVIGGNFGRFAYGIYVPGDPASADGRRLTVTGATFTDLAQLGILSVASATITGNTFQLESGVPEPALNRPYGAVRVVAPNGEVDVSANVIIGTGSVDTIRVLGSSVDGKVASATVSGNTIQDIVAGNGIQVVQVDSAVIEDNIVANVDHSYFINPDDPSEDGLIVNGFGISCFQVTECATSGNLVTNSGFANLVVVNSFFSSVDDTLQRSVWRGAQVEQSQGTFTGLTVTDIEGVALTFIDSTISADDITVTGTRRGGSFQDFDELEDPLPEEVLRYYGGDALESFSNGSASFLELTGSHFEDNVDTAVVSQDGQLVLLGNTFVNNGFEFDDGSGIVFGPGPVIQLSRGDLNALQGPLIQDNVIDGNGSSWAVNVLGTRDARISGNTICGGTTAGMFFSGNVDGTIAGNLFGTSAQGDVAACAGLTWTYDLYATSGESEGITTIEGNVFAGTTASYGLYVSSLGAYALDDNLVQAGTTAALRATATLPGGLTSDNDGDGIAEYQGDCDDTDSAVWWNRGAQSGPGETLGDGKDNDCDGVVDDGLDPSDADGDGTSVADGDCDDGNASVGPAVVEVVGNGRDDDCALFGFGADRPSRWADFDGNLALSVALSGNTFDGVGTAIDADGADLVVLPGATPNTFTNLAGTAFVVDDWNWSSQTPEALPGSLDVADGTVVSGVLGDCVLVQGDGTAVTIGAVDLDGCGGAGVSMFAAGTVVLDGTTITDPGEVGIELGAGSTTLLDVTISGSGGDGLYAQGGSVVASGLEIANPTDDGVAVSSSGVSAPSVTLDGAIVSGALGDGVEVLAGTVAFQGGSIASSGLAGINALGGTLSVATSTVAGGGTGVVVAGGADVSIASSTLGGASGAGVQQSAGTLALTECTVQNAGASGIAATAGSLTVDGGLVAGNAGAGIALSGTVAASVSDVLLEQNGTYGLTCDGGAANPAVSTVLLPVCTATASGNLSGDFSLTNGCEVDWACAAP